MILETMFSKCFGSSDVSRDHFWHLRSHVGASGMPCKAPQQEQKCLRGVRLAVSRPSAPKMGTKINPRMRKTNMKKRLRMRLGKGLQKSVQKDKKWIRSDHHNRVPACVGAQFSLFQPDTKKSPKWCSGGSFWAQESLHEAFQRGSEKP